MRIQFLTSFISTIIFFLSCCNGSKENNIASSTGQSKNSYQFIDPNISISYDSAVYKITNRYFNGSYKTESDDFTKLDDPAHPVLIHISADYLDYPPTMNLQDSLTGERREEIKGYPSDTISILATADKKINGFSCTGTVLMDNIHKTQGSVIKGLKLFDGGYCEVALISRNRNDLEKEYQILDSFLSGFKFYTKKQINEQDELIRKKYTIEVDTGNSTPGNYRDRPKTYSGIVRVKEKLEHKVAQVSLGDLFSSEIFFPEENGEVKIVSVDRNQGEITKHGEFAIFNSFGKKVYIPFSFSYISKGVKD